MAVRPWRRELERRLRYVPRRGARTGGRREPGRAHPVLVTAVVALVLAAGIIGLLQAKLRPLVAEAARTQVQNQMTSILEQAVLSGLSQREVSYAGLVTIQRDDSGTITALTTNTAALNLLRAELLSDVLAALEGVDVSTIHIPLGSLFDFEPVWATGPAIQVRAMSVGTVSAEFESRFSSAGVNQTHHQIWLEVSAPITVMLPGSRVEVPVDTCVVVAETVIVGQVPQAYFQLDGSVTG